MRKRFLLGFIVLTVVLLFVVSGCKADNKTSDEKAIIIDTISPILPTIKPIIKSTIAHTAIPTPSQKPTPTPMPTYTPEPIHTPDVTLNPDYFFKSSSSEGINVMIPTHWRIVTNKKLARFVSYDFAYFHRLHYNGLIYMEQNKNNYSSMDRYVNSLIRYGQLMFPGTEFAQAEMTFANSSGMLYTTTGSYKDRKCDVYMYAVEGDTYYHLLTIVAEKSSKLIDTTKIQYILDSFKLK